MEGAGLLVNAAIYLAAAVVAVPLFARLGLGAVLGYLVAGVVIGPWVLGLIDDSTDILHFAEFGVVLLLFLIGLELNPARLWSMRRAIFGLGGAQVALTSVLLYFALDAFGLEWRWAVVGALGLSLSSTAIALQTLTERNLLTTPAGHAGFGVLLFQDIAVIPMLAVIPLLAGFSGEALDAWIRLLKILAAIGVIVVGGRYVVLPLFRRVAESGVREIFTACALLLVIAIALIMQLVGLSMALGAFLAGVLLAESEYRHALESDIEPFKGLLLGLFFIAVGMSIDFGVLFGQPLLVLELVAVLLLVKIAVLWALAAAFRLPLRQHAMFACVLAQGGEFAFVLFGQPLLVLELVAVLLLVKIAVLWALAAAFRLPLRQHAMFACLLAQGGEFAFVIFATAVDAGVLDPQWRDLLIGAVVLSMMATPLLLNAIGRWVEPLFNRRDQRPMDAIEDEANPVLIVGFGRFGQIVGRLLHANGIGTTILDHDPQHIDLIRRFGFKVFYGDGGRLDLLEAAGAAQARLLVLALDDRAEALRITAQAREHFPHLRILARAWDAQHLLELREAGVDAVEREAFEGSLRLGERALHALGFTAWRAKQAAHRFRAHDETLTEQQFQHFHEDLEVRGALSASAREQLREQMELDEEAFGQYRDGDWR